MKENEKIVKYLSSEKNPYQINVENIENSERYTQFDIIESEKTKGEIFVFLCLVKESQT